MSLRMQAMLRILGAIIAASSLISLPPLIIAVVLGEDTTAAFLESMATPGIVGLLLWWPVRHLRYELRLRDGFFITTGIWMIASLITALPFTLAAPYLSYTDAVFEATSGLTTTGATTITGLDALPRSMVFFRQSLNFYGGMGIVILAIAILPMLKIGGMQLFRAETNGLQKDNKLTPRIAETARALWMVYLGLNVLCALSYWIGGMTFFDAICHGMSTVATGGFSTHDASFGFWNNPLLESVAIIFMLLGALNFGMHWYAWRRATVSHYQSDSELRTFVIVALVVALLVAANLYLGGHPGNIFDALRHGLFQSVSNITTSGFISSNYSEWPGLAPLLLIMVAFIGGCAGSTAGGIKVARVQMVVRQGLREIKQLVHPKGQFLVTVGGKRVSESVVISVAGFCTLYICSYLVMTLILTATGVDIVTAFSAIAACINNMGRGLGLVTSNFQALDDLSIWVCSFAMILGRLEIFTVLVLLTPQFWRE
ncbi:MAG: TrkH family potassium uptake protein [Arenimonas sp.]